MHCTHPFMWGGVRLACLHSFDYIELPNENKSFPQLIDGQRSSSFAWQMAGNYFVSFIIRTELNKWSSDLNGLPCIVRNALISTASHWTNANCHKCVIYYLNWKFHTKERAIDSNPVVHAQAHPIERFQFENCDFILEHSTKKNEYR